MSFRMLTVVDIPKEVEVSRSYRDVLVGVARTYVCESDDDDAQTVQDSHDSNSDSGDSVPSLVDATDEVNSGVDPVTATELIAQASPHWSNGYTATPGVQH